jgi:hypothetical protein
MRCDASFRLLLQGTLDLHHAGPLYLALHRLEARGWVRPPHQEPV